jgi:peptidoglycan/LPS O-acetylase OafA/YrhL
MYKSLQGSRAIAALLVVLFHLGSAVALEKYFGIGAFAIPFKFGSAGVEFFFVLSGFIILTAHRNDISKPHRLTSYISKRLIRIYPTYWIVFLLVFFLAIASSSLRNNVPHDVFLVLKSLLLIPQESGAPVLSVAWTLQYEMSFYLFFAFLILNRWVAIAIGLTLLYFYVTYTGVSPASFPLSFLFRDYVFLFAMGMAVSFVCSTKIMNAQRPIFYVCVGAMLFLCVAMDTVIDTNLLSGWKTLLYGLASSLIIIGLVQAELKGRVIFGQFWMQILGDSSYALYLIHFSVIGILCRFSMSIRLDKLGFAGAMIAYFTILCACLISSVAFHLWIEKPVVAYLRNRRISSEGGQQKAPAGA